ncbi:MAG: hypothetical protein AAF750_13260 [Planctomycetota bacterium]
MGSPRVEMSSVFERMGEAQGLAESGRLAEAEMVLHGMKREAGCPEVVRTTLAAWMARRGEYASAESLLAERGEIGVNRKLMAAMGVLRGDDGAGENEEALGWLESAGPVEGEALPEAGEAAVERLSGELLGSPGVLPSLVAGLGLMGEAACREHAGLLRAGVARVVDELVAAGHGQTVCRAMARLNELLGDHASAGVWARRGLAESPTDEKLGLLLSRQPDEADVGEGEATSVVLARISEAHPDYPDVRAALIRRLMKDGEAGEAMRRLEAWRAEEPGCGIAEALEQEVAA